MVDVDQGGLVMLLGRIETERNLISHKWELRGRFLDLEVVISRCGTRTS